MLRQPGPWFKQIKYPSSACDEARQETGPLEELQRAWNFLHWVKPRKHAVQELLLTPRAVPEALFVLSGLCETLQDLFLSYNLTYPQAPTLAELQLLVNSLGSCTATLCRSILALKKTLTTRLC